MASKKSWMAGLFVSGSVWFKVKVEKAVLENSASMVVVTWMKMNDLNMMMIVIVIIIMQ